MTFEEKSLYQQIHPFKLGTDIVSGLISLWLLWVHEFIPAILISFIPSVIATVAVMNSADLEMIKHSAAGKYLQKYMTRKIEALRMFAYFMMAVGAWFNIAWLILAGVVLLLACWFNGILK